MDCRLPPVCSTPGSTCDILPIPSINTDICGNTISYVQRVRAVVPNPACQK